MQRPKGDVSPGGPFSEGGGAGMGAHNLFDDHNLDRGEEVGLAPLRARESGRRARPVGGWEDGNAVLRRAAAPAEEGRAGGCLVARGLDDHLQPEG